jgi:hypothetical protein
MLNPGSHLFTTVTIPYVIKQKVFSINTSSEAMKEYAEPTWPALATRPVKIDEDLFLNTHGAVGRNEDSDV